MQIKSKNVTGYLACLLLASMLLGSCTNMSSVYSEQAYQQAVSLKVESLALMEHATESYISHQSEVEALIIELDKAQTYAMGRPKNEITTRQWEILNDPDGNLLGGFLTRWEEEGALGETFVQEAQGLVSDAFDTIIQLESGKIKPSELE